VNSKANVRASRQNARVNGAGAQLFRICLVKIPEVAQQQASAITNK
jgi:hypothetical protein